MIKERIRDNNFEMVTVEKKNDKILSSSAQTSGENRYPVSFCSKIKGPSKF